MDKLNELKVDSLDLKSLSKDSKQTIIKFTKRKEKLEILLGQ